MNDNDWQTTFSILEAENERLRAALEAVAGHFCPGDERRTYSSDIPGVMDRIRATAREALEPSGCPCVGTPDPDAEMTPLPTKRRDEEG